MLQSMHLLKRSLPFALPLIQLYTICTCLRYFASESFAMVDHLAYRNGEAKVVVVMTQQPKLEMEATFRRIIPEEQRFGSKFVFRQGSAIIPDNLRMVASSRAAATIIVSDSSR